MFDDELKSKLQKFWQSNLEEIKENKVRFAAVLILFIVAVILLFTEDNGGEKINISENPAPVENSPPENLPADKKIITVKNAATSNADKNITAVLGANAENLYVHDPFKTPPEEKFQPPPEIPAVIIPPPVAPVAQVPLVPTLKFALRGTVIIGYKKSALIQIISDDKNSANENLILEIGDTLNGKKILDINPDSVTLEGGEILYLNIFSP